MPTESWPVAGLLLVALAAYDEVLEHLRRFELRAGHAAWFGYARDGVNLFGGVALFAAFFAAGFGGPGALLLGVTLGLVVYVADFAAGRWLRLRAARLLVFGATGTLGLLALLFAGRLAVTVQALLIGAAPH